jgi:hypothetical protein
LPLSEVDELAPFFAVVDQADRARSGEGARLAGGRSADGLASRPTPARQAVVPRPGSRRRENGLGGDGMLSARIDSGPTPSFDAGTFPPDDGRGEEPFETMTIFRRSRNIKIAGAAGFVALAIVAAFIAFRHAQPAKAVTHAADVPAPAPPPPVAAAVAPPPAAAPPPVAAIPPPPPHAPAAPVDPVAAAKNAPSAPASAEPAKPKTYERLVAEADRLMENGQPARAQKLLDEALAMQPNGVAALSGVAYLQLDRQRPLAAISTFKRALGLSPEFPPALFGLAEAYRAQGEIGHAAENYRKYLGVAAGGPDAPAARRQLKEIESLMPKKPAPAPEAAPAKSAEPAAAEQTP